MKKIYIILSVAMASLSFAQVKTNFNVSQNEIKNLTPFFDASSSMVWNSSTNNGKGFVFPRTDLTTLTSILGPGRPGDNNAPTRYDGMIVYNVATGAPGIGASETPNVTPGFYYYKNESNDFQGGHWVRIGSGKANQVPVADYKSTAVATGAKFYINNTDSKPVFRKMVDVNFSGTYAKLPDNTFNDNDVFINAYLVNQENLEVVGSVRITKKETNGKKEYYVYSSNGSLFTTLNGLHKLITEYYVN